VTLPLVIIPIFNALDELETCLSSVARTIPKNTQVLVIDDASTDVGVQPLLSSWVDEDKFKRSLLTNKKNLGFVATANRGMRLAKTDVVLLNTDTEVTVGWLECLKNCLDSDPSIATATPWSNNGEIVSIPEFCGANSPPDDADAVAAVIASCGSATYPDMPTAVGFCMAISLELLACSMKPLSAAATARKMTFANAQSRPVFAMCFAIMPMSFITAEHHLAPSVLDRMSTACSAC
jgi:GT2 family glycosyltransferase